MSLNDIIDWAMRKYGFTDDIQLHERIFLICKNNIKHCDFDKNVKSYFATIASREALSAAIRRDLKIKESKNKLITKPFIKKTWNS